MSDDERGKKRKVPPSPRYAVHCAPTPAQRLHSSLKARADSRRRALQALGLSDDEGVLGDVCCWPLDRVRKGCGMRRSEGWNKGQGSSGRIRKRRWGKRERVERGGWCPEGSFEFEWESPGESFLIQAAESTGSMESTESTGSAERRCGRQGLSRARQFHVEEENGLCRPHGQCPHATSDLPRYDNDTSAWL